MDIWQRQSLWDLPCSSILLPSDPIRPVLPSQIRLTQRWRASGLAAGLARPNVRLALAALVVGQLVMVLIMTGTPIHIRDHGHGLSLIGLVIGGHTFGMFAFSPLTGKLANRFGRVPVMMSGQGVLFAAAASGPVTGNFHPAFGRFTLLVGPRLESRIRFR